MFSQGSTSGGGRGDEEDDASSDIEVPAVNITSHHRRARMGARTPGLLDKLTRDVTKVYRELTSPGPATSAERADLGLTQQLEQMEDIADKMLDRLADYCELLELLRSSTSVALNQNLPKTFETIQAMNTVYDRIDRIEDVVQLAEGLTDGLENAVVRAETELTPKPSTVIKGFLRNLSPFALPKSRDVTGYAHINYYQAPVFSLEELFPPASEDPKEPNSDNSDNVKKN